MDNHDIIIKPLITEQGMHFANTRNAYSFEVNKKANKIQITKAIEDRYGVLPSKVNIVNNRGRSVRYGRSTGTTKAWKKAIIRA